MTYDMSWKLRIEPAEHDLAEIERFLEEFEIDEAGETFLDVLSYGEYEAEPINRYGYSPVADVQDFSRSYPRSLFILTSTTARTSPGPRSPATPATTSGAAGARTRRPRSSSSPSMRAACSNTSPLYQT